MQTITFIEESMLIVGDCVSSLRKELLRLLRTDEEIRYAVAGLLGLEELLKRLDNHEGH